jgi:hypothetical protein
VSHGIVSYKTERHHLDFLIDGVSLYEASNAGARDLIGLLGWAPVERDQICIQRLLLKVPTDLWDARQSIFPCAECGDIGCGAITADVSRTDEKYIWSNFAFENNSDETMTDRGSFAHLGPFIFDAAQYSNALTDVLRHWRRNT